MAKTFCLEVIRALVYLHEVSQIAHRDLHPDNLMVVRDKDAREPGAKTLKLIDFNVSKKFCDGTEVF
jgi:serine/threonine protein kinase